MVSYISYFEVSQNQILLHTKKINFSSYNIKTIKCDTSFWCIQQWRKRGNTLKFENDFDCVSIFPIDNLKHNVKYTVYTQTHTRTAYLAIDGCVLTSPRRIESPGSRQPANLRHQASFFLPLSLPSLSASLFPLFVWSKSLISLSVLFLFYPFPLSLPSLSASLFPVLSGINLFSLLFYFRLFSFFSF